MYINPFVAGILTTVFAELVAFVVLGVISNRKNTKK